jgi:hypothetical protein
LSTLHQKECQMKVGQHSKMVASRHCISPERWLTLATLPLASHEMR